MTSLKMALKGWPSKHTACNVRKYDILTDGCLISDIFKENVECLQQLDADVAPRILVQNVEEERQHIALEKKAEIGKRIC